jgi:putative heme-binding domain-containing protein
VFDAVVDAFTPEQRQAAYTAAPLFAPLTPAEAETAGAGRGGGGGARGAGAGTNPPGAGAPPAGAPPTGAPPTGAPPTGGPPVAGAATPPAGAPGGGGGRGRGGPPALTRNVPLDRQERYDNLVFPRGGGPGVLASGRGGGPNVDNGKKTFDSVCAKCHKVDTVGRNYGPDLSNIQAMPRRDILRAIFFPDEKVDPKYETTIVVTRDKQTIRGLVISEDGRSVTLKTAETVDPVTIQKSRIATRTKERTSIMPDGLPDTVGDNAIRDVVAYLMSSRK